MAPLFRVSHVVFDIDGTLVDFAAAFHAGTRAAAAELSRLLGREVLGRELWEAQQVASRASRTEFGDRGETRMGAFRTAVSSFGCDENHVDSIVAAFTTARDRLVQPYEDAPATVAALRERGFELIAASNGNSELTRLPLFDSFGTKWLAAEVGVSKPDPRFFLDALEHAGAQPQAAVMVGDRLDNDYEPARLAGMHSVLIDRERRVEDGSVVRIGALTELLDLVERAE